MDILEGVVRAFEPYQRKIMKGLESGMTIEVLECIGDVHEIRKSMDQDIKNAVRYIETAQHEQPHLQYRSIIKGVLEPEANYDEDANMAIIREYFPNFLKWKKRGQKKWYFELLALNLNKIQVNRPAYQDSIRLGQEYFSNDLSFLVDASAIHAPNPMLRNSFSISLAQQLEEALDNGDFSRERVASFIFQLKGVDLNDSKLLRAFFDGHFTTKTAFFEQLASLVAVRLGDPGLFSLLEKQHQPGQRALGFNRHFSFVCHSSIPTCSSIAQYTDIPPRITVYVASISGTLTTREEGARRVDQDLLKDGILRYSSVYPGGSRAPNFTLAFDSGATGSYPLQRIEISSKDGQRRVVRRPCRYNSTFRLSDVLRQMLVAYPTEWVDISLLGCQMFEKASSNRSTTNEASSIIDSPSMLQAPSNTEEAYISLKFTDLETAQSDLTLRKLMMLFCVDQTSGIFRTLVEKLENLRVEVGCEIAALNQNQNNTNAMQLEDYIESMLSIDPFDTRVSSTTWNAVIKALTDKTPVRMDQQEEFCSTWKFNYAFLPLM